MDLEKTRQNTTGTILRFSVPAIVAMLLTSLITAADGFFVGNYVGAEGIAAASLLSAEVSFGGRKGDGNTKCVALHMAGIMLE